MAELDQGILGKAKSGYFFLEDKYYALLDKINEHVPIYKIIDPIDRVIPSFALIILLVALVVMLFSFLSVTIAPFSATLQVVDSKDEPIENVDIELAIAGEVRQLFTDDWGEARLEIPENKIGAEASFSKEGFQTIEREFSLTAGQTTSITMQREQPVSLNPDETEKTVRVVDGPTGRLLSKRVRLSFQCTNGASPPIPQTGTIGEFTVTQPSNCPSLIATAEADGYTRKSAALSSKTTVISLSPNISETTGSINVAVRDSLGNPEPDAVVRAIEEGSNLEAASSSTTLSGTALLSGLQPGTYTVSASSPDGRTGRQSGIEVRAGETTNASIELPSQEEEDIKKIYLKLVERGTSSPVSSAQALIYEDNLLIDSTTSDSGGIVEKRINSTGSAYLVVLTHPDFVTVVEPHVPLKDLSDQNPINVPMTRATIDGPNPTSAEAIVTVLDEDLVPVEGALATIYSSEFPEIPLKSPSGQTLEDGTYTFTNLAPGSYFARAKSQEGSSEGQSETVSASAGQTIHLEIVLVLGHGTVQATVFDADSASKDPIANAEVEFVDAQDPLSVLSTCTTSQDGKCESEPIPADRFVNVRASASGFITGSHISTIDIINNNRATAKIGLIPDSSVPLEGTIGVAFSKFCSDKLCTNPVSKIQSDPAGTTTYYAMFWLQFKGEATYDNTVQHVRAGPDAQISLPAAGYRLKINNAFGAFSSHAVLSRCWNNDAFNPFTDPTDCGQGADSKQANIYYPILEGRQVIPFVIEFKVEPGLADGQTLEIRYRAKTAVNSEEILSEEKLLRFAVNEAVCGGENFTWSFTLEDSEATKTVPGTAPESINELLMNETYTLSYSIYNCTGRSLSSASVTAQNVPVETGAISFTATEPYDFGPTTLQGPFALPAQTEASFQQALFAANETDLVTLELAMESEAMPSIQSLGFSVQAGGILAVEHVPGKLPSFGSPSLSGRVTNLATSAPVENAFVKLRIGGSERTAATDSAGLFSINAIEGLSGLSSATLEVRKAGFKTFEKQVEVGSEPYVPNQSLECITIEKAGQPEAKIYFVKNASSADSFTIKNNCTSDAVIRLSSELRTSPVDDFTLRAAGQPNDSRTITVYSETKENSPYPLYIGEYGVEVMARFATDDPLAGFAGPLHTARVYVTDPDSCFRLADPDKPSDTTAMKSTYDVSQGPDSALIINKCFAYFEDLSMPSIEKVYGYTPVENAFSIDYTPPTQPGIEVEKQRIFNLDEDYFEDGQTLSIDLVDNAGYVFVDWVDFLMTDGRHESGDVHRVWAQTHKNVWTNITAQLPYTLPTESTLDNCDTTCKSECGRYFSLRDCRTVCTAKCPDKPDITTWNPVVDNFGWIDTDRYYPTGGEYSDQLTTRPMWQGQHNVCNQNLDGFGSVFGECSVKGYFQGKPITAYKVGNVANKILLEVDGTLGTRLSAARWKYISTDADHKGLIDFEVRNNTLLGEAYAILEAEDTTGVFWKGSETITVDWILSKRGVLAKPNSLDVVDRKVVVEPGKVLVISTDGSSAVFDGLGNSCTVMSPGSPKEVTSVEFTSDPNTHEFQMPEGKGEPNISFYRCLDGSWSEPALFDVENAGETDTVQFTQPTTIDVIAFENNSEENLIVGKVALNYQSREFRSIQLGSGKAEILPGQSYVEASLLPDQPLPPDPLGQYESVEYVIEDITPEGIVYFSDTKSSTSPDPYSTKARIIIAVSSPEQESNTQTERFHVRLEGPSQQQCFGAGGMRGSTGEGAAPRVKLNWDWDSIGLDSCSPDNPGFVYCDPTQFTISLVKRLEEIRRLAEEDITGNLLEIREMQDFKAYLIEDAYTQDFRQDFVEFFGNRLFEYELTNIEHPWANYILDEEKLVFETSGAGSADPTQKQVEAGLHDVYLQLDFEADQFDFFYIEGEGESATIDLLAEITAHLSKLSKPAIKSPFYYLPFNGDVGRLDNGVLDRQGYGLVFLDSGEPLAIFSDIGGSFYTTESPEGSVGKKPVGTYRESSFNTVNILDRGMIMQVAQDHSQINFAPTTATPVLLEMSPQDAKVEAFYWLRDEDGEIPLSAASFMNLWNGSGATGILRESGKCTDYYGNELQYRVQDRIPESGSCAYSTEGSYGFGYDPALINEKLFFETVFYVPEGMNVNLRKSCENGSFFYAPGPDAAQRTDTVSTPVSLSIQNSSTRVATMQDAIRLISEGDVCISDDEDFFSFWWNPQKVLERLSGIKNGIDPGWDSEASCNVVPG